MYTRKKYFGKGIKYLFLLLLLNLLLLSPLELICRAQATQKFSETTEQSSRLLK